MKKIIAVGMILMLTMAMVACGGSKDAGSGGAESTGSRVSDEEAELAFMTSFVAIFTASMGLAFGQEVPGASLDPDTEVLTFTDFDMSVLASEESEIPYTAVSGTATPVDDDMAADLTMVGGPVESIQYTMSSEMLQSEDGFSITVTVNGREMDLDLTPEDLQ